MNNTGPRPDHGYRPRPLPLPITVQFELQNLKVTNNHIYVRRCSSSVGLLVTLPSPHALPRCSATSRYYFHSQFKGYLQMTWLDERLRYDTRLPERGQPIYISLGSSASVWTPDAYFDKSTTSQYIFAEDESFINLYPNGTLLWSRKARFCEREASKRALVDSWALLARSSPRHALRPCRASPTQVPPIRPPAAPSRRFVL